MLLYCTWCDGITSDVKGRTCCEGTHFCQGHGARSEHGKWRCPPRTEPQPLLRGCHGTGSSPGQPQAGPLSHGGRAVPEGAALGRAGPGWAAAPRSPPRCCRCSAALGRPLSPRPRRARHGRAAAAAAWAPAARTACETPVSAAVPPLRHRCQTLCRSRRELCWLCPRLKRQEVAVF